MWKCQVKFPSFHISHKYAKLSCTRVHISCCRILNWIDFAIVHEDGKMRLFPWWVWWNLLNMTERCLYCLSLTHFLVMLNKTCTYWCTHYLFNNSVISSHLQVSQQLQTIWDAIVGKCHWDQILGTTVDKILRL